MNVKEEEEEEEKKKVKVFGLLCFLGREQECFSSFPSPVPREVTEATGGVIVPVLMGRGRR
jgi:hypothetical protein